LLNASWTFGVNITLTSFLFVAFVSQLVLAAACWRCGLAERAARPVRQAEGTKLPARGAELPSPGFM